MQILLESCENVQHSCPPEASVPAQLRKSCCHLYNRNFADKAEIIRVVNQGAYPIGTRLLNIVLDDDVAIEKESGHQVTYGWR